VNKFEALKTFQAWPPEWQRLCAEYWIETGEVDPKFVLAFPKQTAGELVQRRAFGDCIDQGEMKLEPMPKAAAKVAKRPARDGMRYSRDEVSEVDSHLSEGRSCYETAKIMDRKHPNQRTKHAWKQLADRIRGLGFKVMMDRAIDVEFK
jgi:hypothetical protein